MLPEGGMEGKELMIVSTFTSSSPIQGLFLPLYTSQSCTLTLEDRKLKIWLFVFYGTLIRSCVVSCHFFSTIVDQFY